MGAVEVGRKRVERLVRAGRMSERQGRSLLRVYGYLEARPPGLLRRFLRWPGEYPVLQARFLAGEFGEDAYRRKILSDFLTCWAVFAIPFILLFFAPLVLGAGASMDLKDGARVAGVSSAFGLLGAGVVHAFGRFGMSKMVRFRRQAEDDEDIRGEDVAAD